MNARCAAAVACCMLAFPARADTAHDRLVTITTSATGEQSAFVHEVPALAAMTMANPQKGLRATVSLEILAPGTVNRGGVTCGAWSAAAQAALTHAVNLWASRIESPVTITLRACSGTSLSSSQSSVVQWPLKHNFQAPSYAETWYPLALANALAGTQLRPGDADMDLAYNPNPTPAWYFGTDGRPPAGQFDFVSTVLRDLAKGLGFSGNMKVSGGTGSWGFEGKPDIYELFLEDPSGVDVLDTTAYPNPSSALGTALQNGVLFAGPQAVKGNSGSRVPLLASANYDGYSPTRLAEAYKTTADSAVAGSRSTGQATHRIGPVTLGMLQDLGWTVRHRAGADGDVSLDGKSDVFYRNAANGQVFRLLMNGLAVTSGGFAYAEPDTEWKVVGCADLNGDGVGDLVWRHGTTGRVYLMTFGSNGLVSGGAIVHVEPNPAWKIIHTPDLDGDGRADLLWWNASTGHVYAMLMDGFTILRQGFVYSEPNTTWRIVAAGDFGGSGKQNQLLWRNATSGHVFLMTVSVGSGGFTQAGQMIYREPDTAWGVIGAADLNGDGRADMVWRNASTGQVHAMLMNGTSVSGQAQVHHEPNLAWKIVALGDYNGDGKSDLLWRNENTGHVFMMVMNGLSPASQGMVYAENNLDWKILGPGEFAAASGVTP